MDKEKVLCRISKQLLTTRICQELSDLSSKNWQSLLLYVSENRAAKEDVHTLFERCTRNRFVQSSRINQRELIEFDRVMYQNLPDKYDAVELAPVTPFGTNAVLTGTNQKNVASSVRLTEAVADITTALCLECVREKVDQQNRSQNIKDINIATSQRILRMQNFDSIPGFSPHFRMFALATSAPAKKRICFVGTALEEHAACYLKSVETLAQQRGYSFQGITLALSHIRIAEALIEYFHLDRKAIGRETQNAAFQPFSECGCALPSQVETLDELLQSQAMLREYKIAYFIDELQQLDPIMARLRKHFPQVHMYFDLHRIAGMGYYQDFCFKITAHNRLGKEFPLIDGGNVDWMQKLLQSKQERLFISGIGTEIVCRNFR